MLQPRRSAHCTGGLQADAQQCNSKRGPNILVPCSGHVLMLHGHYACAVDIGSTFASQARQAGQPGCPWPLIAVPHSLPVDLCVCMRLCQVEYRERLSAAGRLPMRPDRRERVGSEREVLVARLIDRAVRPLLPPGFLYDTQVCQPQHDSPSPSWTQQLEPRCHTA
jgi:hypothetical protein